LAAWCPRESVEGGVRDALKGGVGTTPKTASKAAIFCRLPTDRHLLSANFSPILRHPAQTLTTRAVSPRSPSCKKTHSFCSTRLIRLEQFSHRSWDIAPRKRLPSALTKCPSINNYPARWMKRSLVPRTPLQSSQRMHRQVLQARAQISCL
jgi:hypothetical protein